MKELSIQEKATRYDEALARANEMIKSMTNIGGVAKVDDIQHIFPELKESDDELMIQYFKDLAPFDKADELYEKYGFSHKDAIAWLEKQGVHAKFINGIQVGDKVTRSEYGVLVNLSKINRVANKQGEQKIKTPEESLGIDSDTYNKIVDECIYGEQKPIYKVEPNFKVGDWVVYCNDDVDLITGIEENGYCVNNSGYIPFICESDIRLWTIQDVKDGDVLFTSSTASHETFIFKNIDEKGNAKCYFAYDSEDGFIEGKYHFIGRVTKCKPATKEQHDILFQKMKEAGYEWDAEKKELIKIEQKPASWSKEDEEIYRKCICAMRASACGFPEEEKFVEQVDNWFKSLKYRYSWKPSEEQMNTLEYYMHTLICNEHKEVLFGLYADLKKLM